MNAFIIYCTLLLLRGLSTVRPSMLVFSSLRACSARAYPCGTCCMTLTSLVIALLPSRLQSGPRSGCWLYDFFARFLCYCFFRRIVVVLCIWLLFGWFGSPAWGSLACRSLISIHVLVSLGGGVSVGISPTLFRSRLVLQ